jgi:transketolase
MIQELTYIVYTINQSKHTKVKAGRDGKWHNPCELITWLEAIAECQVKNSQDQYMNQTSRVSQIKSPEPG